MAGLGRPAQLATSGQLNGGVRADTSASPWNFLVANHADDRLANAPERNLLLDGVTTFEHAIAAASLMTTTDGTLEHRGKTSRIDSEWR